MFGGEDCKIIFKNKRKSKEIKLKEAILRIFETGFLDGFSEKDEKKLWMKQFK